MRYLIFVLLSSCTLQQLHTLDDFIKDEEKAVEDIISNEVAIQVYKF